MSKISQKRIRFHHVGTRKTQTIKCDPYFVLAHVTIADTLMEYPRIQFARSHAHAKALVMQKLTRDFRAIMVPVDIRLASITLEELCRTK